MKRRNFICLTSLSLASLCHVAPAIAQQDSPTTTSGPFARIVVIEPKPGQRDAFVAGYERHIEWHRNQNDPWTWYGWSFVLGERIGLFMDGTFGHAAADFDAAVKPAEDSADNAVNVTPSADFLSHGIYEQLDTLSVGRPLPDTAAFLALTTYRVVPGRERVFEALLEKNRTGTQGEDNIRYTWLRLRIGGSSPQYLLLRPVTTFGAAATLPDFFDAGRTEETTSAATIAGMVESVRNELLRYQPTLSYHP